MEGFGASPTRTESAFSAHSAWEVHQAREASRHRGFDVEDAMTYRPGLLSTWWTLLVVRRTAWDNGNLWPMMFALFVVSLITAAVVYVVMPDPNSQSTTQSIQVISFLNIPVACLLGLFVTLAVQRWLDCIQGFIGIFGAIRHLQILLQSLDLPSHRLDLCYRYGIVSVCLLKYELEACALPTAEKSEAAVRKWSCLHPSKCHPDSLAWLDDGEVELLKQVQDRPGMMWTWMASLVGRMAQDGETPPNASPTFCHLLESMQQARDCIRQVRTSVLVQTPFRYMHAMALLVLLNNIVYAMDFGLCLSCYIDPFLVAMQIKSPQPGVQPLTWEFLSPLKIAFVKGFVGPLLYQSFLDIGVAIQSPFQNSDGEIPVTRMLRDFEKVIQDSRVPPPTEEGSGGA